MMALRLKRKHNQSATSNEPTKPASDQALQTFSQHIGELRRRLTWSVLLGLVVGSVVYYYHDFFVEIVMKPLGHHKLVYLTPVGGFSFIFAVTMYVTIILILPFVLYQIYAFIRPAIPVHTSKLSFRIGLAAIVLMAMGATFGYLYAVPGGLNFLTNFASNYVTPSLTADSYLKFVLGYVLGLGALFELPLLLLFWHWMRPMTPKGLLNSERYIIVAAFIVAAVISPSPDVMSQTIVAVPIIIVYQFGVVAVLLSIRKTRRAQKRAAKAAAAVARRQAERARQLVPAPVPVSAPVRPVVAAAVAPKPAALASPVRRRKGASMDGFVAAHAASAARRPPRPLHQSVPKATPRPPARLTVPARPRLISDFGPIRQQNA